MQRRVWGEDWGMVVWLGGLIRGEHVQGDDQSALALIKRGPGLIAVRVHPVGQCQIQMVEHLAAQGGGGVRRRLKGDLRACFTVVGCVRWVSRVL